MQLQLLLSGLLSRVSVVRALADIHCVDPSKEFHADAVAALLVHKAAMARAA
jgi:hypothetical protein